MQVNKTSVIAKCVMLAFGLGLVAVFLQIALDQARLTSCNPGSSDPQCLAPSVANYGLSSDGPERKVSAPSQKSSP